MAEQPTGNYRPEALLYMVVFMVAAPVVLLVVFDALYRGCPRERAKGRTHWFDTTQIVLVAGVFGLVSAPLVGMGTGVVFAGICGAGAVLAMAKLKPDLMAKITPSFKVPCGQCGKAVLWQQPWFCGVCGRLNGDESKTSGPWSFLKTFFYDGPFDGTILDRCGAKDCGNRPSAVCCPKCGSLVALAAEPGEAAHAAYFPGARPARQPPPPPRESKEQKRERQELDAAEKKRRERERKAEEVRWKTDMDNMLAERLMAERRKMEAKAKRDAAKPKTAEERKREEIEREGREQQIVSEWAAAERAKAEQMADPEERQRRLEEIDYMASKHSV